MMIFCRELDMTRAAERVLRPGSQRVIGRPRSPQHAREFGVITNAAGQVEPAVAGSVRRPLSGKG